MFVHTVVFMAISNIKINRSPCVLYKILQDKKQNIIYFVWPQYVQVVTAHPHSLHPNVDRKQGIQKSWPKLQLGGQSNSSSRFLGWLSNQKHGRSIEIAFTCLFLQHINVNSAIFWSIGHQAHSVYIHLQKGSTNMSGNTYRPLV